jgi:membrane-bound ClpP family serine protease
MLALSGALSLVVGYAIHKGEMTLLGLPVDWSLLFGIAFIELVIIAVALIIIRRVQFRKSTTGVESMIGEPAEVIGWAGTKGDIRIQGEIWKAWSDSAFKVSKGDTVTVQSVDGLKIKVTKEAEGK